MKKRFLLILMFLFLIPFVWGITWFGDSERVTYVYEDGFGKIGSSPYLYNDTDTIYFNDTFANVTYVTWVQANDTFITSAGEGMDYTNVAMLNESALNESYARLDSNNVFAEDNTFTNLLDKGNFTVCADNEIMKVATDAWACEADATGGGGMDYTNVAMRNETNDFEEEVSFEKNVTFGTSINGSLIYVDTIELSDIGNISANVALNSSLGQYWSIYFDLIDSTALNESYLTSFGLDTIAELNSQITDATAILYSDTLSDGKWCVATGTAGDIDCNVEPVTDTDTYFTPTNVAFLNETQSFTELNHFAENVSMADNLTVGADVLYVDSSTGRVGIGTSSPISKLEILGTSDVDGFSYVNTLFNGSTTVTQVLLSSADKLAGFELVASDGDFNFYNGLVKSMTIDTTGKVGIGTSSPGSALDISSGNFSMADKGFIYPFGSANPIYYYGYNSDLAGMEFKLNNLDVMFLHSSGKVGIGTTNPNVPLHVKGYAGDAAGSYTSLKLESGAAYTQMSWDSTSNTGLIQWDGDGTAFGKNGNSGWAELSARKYKTDIEPLQYGLDEIMEYAPIQFKSVFNEKGKLQLGIIADDSVDIIPNLVGYKNNTVESFNYVQLIPVLVKSAQELKTLFDIIYDKVFQNHEDRIAQLEAENLELNLQIINLTARIEALEGK